METLYLCRCINKVPIGGIHEPLLIPNGGGIADFPQHCANQERCINRIPFGFTSHPSVTDMIGCFLENPLSEKGQQAITQALLDGNPHASLWDDFYNTAQENEEEEWSDSDDEERAFSDWRGDEICSDEEDDNINITEQDLEDLQDKRWGLLREKKDVG